MNQRVEALTRALCDMHNDDLNELSIDQLDRIEADLKTWASLAFVAAMAKRAAIRDEEITQ
jgi:hypothetical protein